MRKPITLHDRRDSASLLDWLDTRQNYERKPPRASKAAFSLGRMRRLLEVLDNPHHAFPVVHVAGTKGKGSTVAMLAAILDTAGYRTGRYMSPHVHSLGERICIGGIPILPAELAAACEIVRPAVDRLDQLADRRDGQRLTWFEVVTAVAFVHFAQAGVDIAVLETGLGGRLDATNVSRPIVSVITSISLDHMKLLGRTVGRIATEKAGIIKRGCPVISGAMHPAARRVIAATARRRRARLFQYGRDFLAEHLPADGDPLAAGAVCVQPPTGLPHAAPIHATLGMAGRHQADNAALAVVAALLLDGRGFAIPEAAIAKGLAEVQLPARIETIGRRPVVIVDAAHNGASMESLIETLAVPLSTHRPRVLLFSASGDKQLTDMLVPTRGWFDHVILTRYQSNPRAAELERLVAACRTAGLQPPQQEDSPPAGFHRARELAGNQGIIVVAGSFFLAAEVRALAGLTGRP